MEVEELFRKLKPVLGEKMDSLWLEYQLNPDGRKEIEGLLHVLVSKHLGRNFNGGGITLTPPTKERVSGEYILGTVYYGETPLNDFGLREHEWIQHVGIFGRTGSGKTNVGFLIVKDLLQHAKPFVIFDWKRNYRDLLSLQNNKDIAVFTVGRDISPFHFNPLIPPPGTKPTVWLKKLIEIMCHVYWLGEGVAYLLQKALDAVYKASSVYDGSQNYPTLLQVKEWLENYKARGRVAQWMDSTLRLLGTLCYGDIGDVLNASSPDGLKSLLDKRVIFELDALTDNDKTFFIESLLLWIHHYRLQEPEREKFKHAIMIEEAHHVLLKHEQSKESIMDVILREIRELGESIILLDQHPSLISIPSLGNTYTTIAMNLKHARDIATIGDAMLLGTSEREYLGKLETGFGIVRLQGRYAKPFLVKFPLVEIKKGSIDDETLRRMFPTSSTVSQDIPPPIVKQEVIPPIPPQDKVADLMPHEIDMMLDVMHHTISGVAERYRRLSLAPRRASRIVSSLVSKCLLSSDFVATPEGRVRFLQITERGAEALTRAGHECKLGRRGGAEHEYWKCRVGEMFKDAGFQVEYEYRLNDGESIDLVSTKGDKRIAVEIETGKSDAEHNMARDLRLDFDVVCLALSPGVANRLETLFPDELARGLLNIASAKNLKDMGM